MPRRKKTSVDEVEVIADKVEENITDIDTDTKKVSSKSTRGRKSASKVKVDEDTIDKKSSKSKKSASKVKVNEDDVDITDIEVEKKSSSSTNKSRTTILWDENDDLRERIEARAKLDRRSVNAEILLAIEFFLECSYNPLVYKPMKPNSSNSIIHAYEIHTNDTGIQANTTNISPVTPLEEEAAATVESVEAVEIPKPSAVLPNAFAPVKSNKKQ